MRQNDCVEVPPGDCAGLPPSPQHCLQIWPSYDIARASLRRGHLVKWLRRGKGGWDQMSHLFHGLGALSGIWRTWAEVVAVGEQITAS